MECSCGSETFGGSRLVGFGVLRLLLNPIAEIAICELLQIGVVETVIVDQGMKSISPSVPQVPDERTIEEELSVLLKEFIAQPVFESLGFAALESGTRHDCAFVERAERGGEELAQAGSGRLFAVERRQAKDAVLIGENLLLARQVLKRLDSTGKLLPVCRGQP